MILDFLMNLINIGLGIWKIEIFLDYFFKILSRVLKDFVIGRDYILEMNDMFLPLVRISFLGSEFLRSLRTSILEKKF